MACMVGDNIENKEEGNSIKGWKFMLEDYDLRVKKSLMIIVPMNIVWLFTKYRWLSIQEYDFYPSNTKYEPILYFNTPI